MAHPSVEIRLPHCRIPGRDTERFGRTGESASAAIRFVFAIPLPSLVKTISFHTLILLKSCSTGKTSSIPPCPRGKSQRGTQAEANRMGGSYA